MAAVREFEGVKVKRGCLEGGNLGETTWCGGDMLVCNEWNEFNGQKKGW